MTEGPDLEQWLANGFPPPSFVVGPERVTVGGGDQPLQGRLLVGGAILGAVLLITGLILMARSGGGGETALNTAPDTTPTSSIPLVTFPPATVFEPSFLIPEETVPTLPVAPQTPIFPITPQPPAPGPAAGTTQRPGSTTPTTRPGTSATVPSTTATTSPTTTGRSATTTPPPATLSISRPDGNPTYRVPGPDPCSEGWTIKASVSAGLPEGSVKIQFNGGAGVEMVIEKRDASPGRDIWLLTRARIGRPAEVTFTIVATTNGQTAFSGAEKVSC